MEVHVMSIYMYIWKYTCVYITTTTRASYNVGPPHVAIYMECTCNTVRFTVTARILSDSYIILLEVISELELMQKSASFVNLLLLRSIRSPIAQWLVYAPPSPHLPARGVICIQTKE